VRIGYFTHSLRSCWNHGNAHFLRGVLRELVLLGHDVRAFEPADGWSSRNLAADHGAAALEEWRESYPELTTTLHHGPHEAERLCDAADVVIVHEWNDPALVARLGRARAHGARYLLLFHDTHHRAVSDPEAMGRYDLSGYDGVLAFGGALAAEYVRRGWGRHAFVWHEAADTRHFRPPAEETTREGLVWIGNWGDGERSAELEEFLFRPASEAPLPLELWGVRYPPKARRTLAAYGVSYRGWAPNAEAPRIFASKLVTVHVPRRFYVSALPGIPTIRVFEALACGIPLVSAPWDDTEGLFRSGRDFLMARNGDDMTRRLREVRDDAELRAALVSSGLETIRARHTCAHRACELLAVVNQLRAPEALLA